MFIFSDESHAKKPREEDELALIQTEPNGIPTYIIVLWKFLNTVALMAIALLKVWMIFLKTKNPRFLRKKLLVKRKQCY